MIEFSLNLPFLPPPSLSLQYLVRDLGDLLYQGPLLVSEQSRFGVKAEKERHVFAFDRALLFARKVELGQGAKFKYEHKFNVPVSVITAVFKLCS